MSYSTRKNLGWVLFAVAAILILFAIGLARSEGAVVSCGKDVEAIGTESDHARRFGLDPQCEGKGIQSAVVIPGNAKDRHEYDEVTIRGLRYDLNKAKQRITDLRRRLDDIKRDHAADGEHFVDKILRLEKEIARLKKPAAIPAVKSAPVKKGNKVVSAASVKPAEKVGEDDGRDFYAWLVISILAYACFIYFMRQHQKKRRSSAKIQPVAPLEEKEATASEEAVQEVPPIVETETVAPPEETKTPEPEKQA